EPVSARFASRKVRLCPEAAIRPTRTRERLSYLHRRRRAGTGRLRPRRPATLLSRVGLVARRTVRSTLQGGLAMGDCQEAAETHTHDWEPVGIVTDTAVHYSPVSALDHTREIATYAVTSCKCGAVRRVKVASRAEWLN